MPRLLTRDRKSSYCLGFLQPRPNCVSEIKKKIGGVAVVQAEWRVAAPSPSTSHPPPLPHSHPFSQIPQSPSPNKPPSTLLNHLSKTSQSTLFINTHHNFETLLPWKPDSRLDRRGLTKWSASETMSCPRVGSAGTRGSSPTATASSPATAWWPPWASSTPERVPPRRRCHPPWMTEAGPAIPPRSGGEAGTKAGVQWKKKKIFGCCVGMLEEEENRDGLRSCKRI